MYSNLISEDTTQDLTHYEDEFLLDASQYIDESNKNSRRWMDRYFTRIIKTVGCLMLFSTIGSITFFILTQYQHQKQHDIDINNNVEAGLYANTTLSRMTEKIPSNSDMDIIKHLIESTPDIVYYFEEGIHDLSSTETTKCIVLSRYKVFPNTTSILTHQDDFCFDQDVDFGHKEPVIISNDKYLIACFDLIQQDNDYCLFARFDDDEKRTNNDKINMILDFNNMNNTQSQIFNNIDFTVNNLHSFAFYGDQLFGVNVIGKQSLYHWNVSDSQNNFQFNEIPLNVISTDIDLEDEMYPIRLEVHNGFLYLFQRFEQETGVEISKILYFNNTIYETGNGWQCDDGHETLYDDFNRIHGFIFDPEMSKYFMFSDCEMIIENNTRLNTADFYLDSDFKFQFKGNNSNDWTSYYHVKIPIITKRMETSFVFDEKNSFLDVTIEGNNQWILHLDFTHNFVYFPIRFKEYHDSLYFMQLDNVNFPIGSMFVTFHPLNGVKNDKGLRVMSGKSALKVVSGKDTVIQHILDKMDIIHDEAKLIDIVNKYGKHKWAESFYQLLQTDGITHK